MDNTSSNPNADLVLEGGGVKGIALVGAVSVLEEHGYTFARIAGTSAGSIVGALAAGGRSAAEMYQIMKATNFRRFQDRSLLDRVPLMGPAVSLLAHDGIYEGEFFKTWLREHLPPAARTFAGLRLPQDPESSLSPEQRYRLVVMASDVSLRRIARLPWDYRSAYGLDPDQQSVVDAVRASMSIPFFFQPAHIDHAAQRRSGGRPARSTLVDGGMLSNFPVDVFDRKDGRRPRWPTFGIKLGTSPGQQRLPKLPDGPLSLTRAMVATMTSWYDGMHIDRPEVCARTIFVDTFGISATAFDLSPADQDRLYGSGRRAAEKFLSRWDFDRYLEQFRPDSTAAA
jgi:NTE family protein